MKKKRLSAVQRSLISDRRREKHDFHILAAINSVKKLNVPWTRSKGKESTCSNFEEGADRDLKKDTHQVSLVEEEKKEGVYSTLQSGKRTHSKTQIVLRKIGDSEKGGKQRRPFSKKGEKGKGKGTPNLIEKSLVHKSTVLFLFFEVFETVEMGGGPRHRSGGGGREKKCAGESFSC